MKKQMESQLLLVALFLSAAIAATNAMPIVDCSCVANLSGLQTNSCVGVVPDLSVLATNCFSTNVIIGSPGFCTQTPVAGSQVFPGTYVIQLTVTDSQSNSAQCSVPFTVTAPPANLSVVCTSNKTVECGTGWNFDQPIPTTTCCQPFITTTILSTVTNGVCPHIITRTWEFTDTCSNTATCSQTVTEIDTAPPTVQCAGMNLVPNGDFESFTLCPTVSSQFNVAAPWFQPTDGTSDYYNSCSGPNSYVSTPTNSVGVQIPRSGQGYAGILVYTDVGTNLSTSTREYMEVPLITPLVAGQTYRVTFYVSLAEQLAGYGIAEIGAYFSSGAIISNGYGGVLNVVPQVVNPSTNLLNSRTAWMPVTGTFVAAGGEDHLTLGNFLSDLVTTAVPEGGPFFHDSYYYFDDVSVEAVCDNSVTNKVVQCGDMWTFDTPAAYDNCSGTNVTVNITSTVTNGICPRVIMRTWTLTDLCGNSTNWSQTVTIVDNTPPMPICTGGNGTNLVPNGDFEYYTACPSNGGDINVAVPWFQPSDATSDYFNSCATFPFALTPGNGVGYQVPLSGQAYAGIFVFGTDVNIPGSSYREYLEVPLISPLVSNQTYVVSFHVSRAENYASAIAEIGAYFSPGPIISNGYDQVFNFTPQVVNPSTNLLIDTTNWMLVQGTFVATGGESYLILGNFLPDALTTAVPASGTYSNTAYYYFDDVSVEPICTQLMSEKAVPCGQPWDFDAPAGYDNCSGTNVTVSVVNTVTNGTCPRVATRTWVLTDQCGNSTNWSETVTIVDNTPPTLVTCNNVNLVPNPAFELYANCPSTLGQLDFAAPWYTPTYGTADYFNGCAPGMSGVSTPGNSFGNQIPLSGRGYAGGYMYASGGGNMTNSYREYLQTPLSTPLIAGQTYSVSFHVSRAANYAWAIAELGAYFSAGPVTNASPFVLPASPQVENPSANILGSTNSWMLVQGTFTAAGGEDHLTIGNFRSDANTTAQLGIGTYSNSAYYYFDDVSVTAVCWPTNKSVACGAPLNFDPPVGIDNCSGTNVTITVAGTITNGCPPVVTRTWTLADLCGNSTNVSQTITVADTNAPLTLNCACLQDSAIALLNTNTCTGIVPDLSVFTNCYSGGCGVNFSQSPVAGTVVGPGYNLITVSVSDCSGNLICELPFMVNPLVAAPTCPPNIYLLTCSTSAIANFNVGAAVSTPPSGSAFPLGTNVVTYPVTNMCGQVSYCSFDVIVRPVTTRWGCLTFVIAIPYAPMGTAIVVYLPDFPGGGEGVNFENIGSSGQDGVQLLFGPAQKITFSTVLDFNAPPGAGIDLVVPPPPGSSNGTPLLSFVSGCGRCGYDIKLAKLADEDTSVIYRTIAIGTNGELFSSSLHNAADLSTNVIANLQPAPGVTNAVMTVTLDCLTREVNLEFPNCGWTPNAARKGWDGLIYGDGPRGTKTNKTARLVLTPLTGGTPPPITNLYLLASNLSYVPFDNPTITSMGRKWNDGHVTLLKAYDDGTEQGLEFTSLDDGGGVNVDLGHSASFQFRMTHFETGNIPTQEQFSMVGWPPGTTTNRPPPPTNYLRLAPSPGNGAGPGLGGIDCSVDFLQWGVLMVTVQLWNGTTFVAQQTHVLATQASPVATLSGYPSIIGSPSIGVLSLMDTNPITVLGGLNCSAGCTGTELRIVAEMSKGSTPPVAWSGLSCLVGNGMDDLIYALQTTPAATPVSINATATSAGVTLNWAGDGYRLQGAETLSGPWYDLGVSSPLALPPNYTLRVFRLISD